MRTFQVEENIRAIILEHLSYQLHVDILDVDFLAQWYLH